MIIYNLQINVDLDLFSTQKFLISESEKKSSQFLHLEFNKTEEISIALDFLRLNENAFFLTSKHIQDL